MFGAGQRSESIAQRRQSRRDAPRPSTFVGPGSSSARCTSSSIVAQEVVPAPLDDAARLQPGCVLRFRQGARVAVITEGKRRRILRAIAGYGIVAFALLQIVEPIMHGLHLPDRMLTFVVLALALAFPAVVAVSWSLDMLGRRLRSEEHTSELQSRQYLV